jgi:hypothetical protein
MKGTPRALGTIMTTRKQLRSLGVFIAEIFRLRLYIAGTAAMTIGVTTDPGALMFSVLLQLSGRKFEKPEETCDEKLPAQIALRRIH